MTSFIVACALFFCDANGQHCKNQRTSEWQFKDRVSAVERLREVESQNRSPWLLDKQQTVVWKCQPVEEKKQ